MPEPEGVVFDCEAGRVPVGGVADLACILAIPDAVPAQLEIRADRFDIHRRHDLLRPANRMPASGRGACRRVALSRSAEGIPGRRRPAAWRFR